MSARNRVQHIDGGHIPGRFNGWKPVEHTTWKCPESIDQRLGRFVGETAGRVWRSGFGRAVMSTLNFLNPSTAPKADHQPANHNPRGIEPKWADLTQPEPIHSLSDTDHDLLIAAGGHAVVPGPRRAPADESTSDTITDADMAWLAAQANVTSPSSDRPDPTVGLFTADQLDRIEDAFAAVERGGVIISLAANEPTAEHRAVGAR